jgi:hypothetical protein
MPRESGASSIARHLRHLTRIETSAFTGSPAFAGDDGELCRTRIPE